MVCHFFSALKTCRKGVATTAQPPSSTSPSPPDLAFMSTSEREVEVWREKTLADHRHAYQEQLLSSANTTDPTDTVDTSDTDAMEVERVTSDAAVRLGGHVTPSDNTGGHGISHMTHSDVRCSSHVTYGELIDNTEPPQLILDIRKKLDSVLTT